jgi:S-adenosylmethionine hydrolase
LLSDFGTSDGYVAAMKGVILGIAPDARLVDISHDIAPGDLRQAGFVLWSCFRDFPAGTIFVAALDPRGGGQDRPLIAQSERYCFVALDNGVLAASLGTQQGVQVHAIEPHGYARAGAGVTFAGRDVLAPVAAHRGVGVALDLFGPTQAGWKGRGFAQPRIGERRIEGSVLVFDRFGNAVTTIDSAHLPPDGVGVEVMVPGKGRCGLHGYFAQVASGQMLALPGSSGLVELSANGASAQALWGLERDDAVVVEW